MVIGSGITPNVKYRIKEYEPVNQVVNRHTVRCMVLTVLTASNSLSCAMLMHPIGHLSQNVSVCTFQFKILRRMQSPSIPMLRMGLRTEIAIGNSAPYD